MNETRGEPGVRTHQIQATVDLYNESSAQVIETLSRFAALGRESANATGTPVAAKLVIEGIDKLCNTAFESMRTVATLLTGSLQGVRELERQLGAVVEENTKLRELVPDASTLSPFTPDENMPDEDMVDETKADTPLRPLTPVNPSRIVGD